jgi:hypothetical protein
MCMSCEELLGVEVLTLLIHEWTHSSRRYLGIFDAHGTGMLDILPLGSYGVRSREPSLYKTTNRGGYGRFKSRGSGPAMWCCRTWASERRSEPWLLIGQRLATANRRARWFRSLAGELDTMGLRASWAMCQRTGAGAFCLKSRQCPKKHQQAAKKKKVRRQGFFHSNRQSLFNKFYSSEVLFWGIAC